MLSFKSLLNNVLRKDNFTLFLLFFIGTVLILFIKAPYEVAYLIPVIPFLLILLNNISKRKFFAIFCILLMSNGFISFASLNDSDIAGEGLIMHDIEFRNTLLQMQIVVDSNMKDSIIITGEYLYAISYFYEMSSKNHKLIGMIGGGSFETKEKWNFEKNVGYIYSAPLDKIKELQNKGYKIYYIGNSTRNMMNSSYNYDLNQYNVTNILI